jgi:hypothetical protein
MIRNLFVALAVAASSPAFATLAYTTSHTTTSQTFNTLPSSGAASAWTNDTTLDGWYLFNRTGGTVPTILPADGSGNTGSFNSFGTTSNSDRALGGTASGGAYFGSPPSGALAGYIAFGLTNGTGEKLDVFNVRFDGEQWRNGGNATAQTMVLEYGIGNTFGAVTTWTAPGGTFNFTSPVATATAAAVNGNVAGLVTGLGGQIYIPAGLAAGETLWLRWIENNDVGNDHGLGIDNFSISAIPEPTAALFGSLLAGAFGLMVARRPADRE